MEEETDSPKDRITQGNNVDGVTKQMYRLSLNPFSLIRILVLVFLATWFFIALWFSASLVFDDAGQNSVSQIEVELLLIGLVILAGLSLSAFFWSSYIRSLYLKDGPALVPEKWGSIINQLIHETQSAQSRAEHTMSAFQNSAEKQIELSNNLLESFLTMKQ